jgi:hypothetical protein
LSAASEIGPASTQRERLLRVESFAGEHISVDGPRKRIDEPLKAGLDANQLFQNPAFEKNENDIM